jgi:flagellar biosynthesis/type III secretory pathway M-ring protein FliF/YscJ
LLVLLVLFIAVRSGRRPPPPHSTAALALAGRPDTAGAPATAIFPGAQRLPTGKSDSPALDEVSLLAKRDPQMVAQLVRTWIQEDEKGR